MNDVQESRIEEVKAEIPQKPIEHDKIPLWKERLHKVLVGMRILRNMDGVDDSDSDDVAGIKSEFLENGYKPGELSADKVVFPDVSRHQDVWTNIVSHYKAIFEKTDSLREKHGHARTTYENSQADIILLSEALNNDKINNQILDLAGARTSFNETTVQILLQFARGKLSIEEGKLKGEENTSIPLFIAEKAIHDPNAFSFEETQDGDGVISLHRSPETSLLQGIVYLKSEDMETVERKTVESSRSEFFSSLHEYKQKVKEIVSRLVSEANTSDLVKQVDQAIIDNYLLGKDSDPVASKAIESLMNEVVLHDPSITKDQKLRDTVGKALFDVTKTYAEFKRKEKEYILADRHIKNLPPEYADLLYIAETIHPTADLGSKIAELQTAISQNTLKVVYSGKFITIEGATDKLPSLLKIYSEVSSPMIRIHTYKRKTYFTMRVPETNFGSPPVAGTNLN
ncbi:MAG: hypothetical protein ABI758_06955 [Candidatus Woesebacteria bacterium]